MKENHDNFKNPTLVEICYAWQKGRCPHPKRGVQFRCAAWPKIGYLKISSNGSYFLLTFNLFGPLKVFIIHVFVHDPVDNIHYAKNDIVTIRKLTENWPKNEIFKNHHQTLAKLIFFNNMFHFGLFMCSHSSKIPKNVNFTHLGHFL